MADKSMDESKGKPGNQGYQEDNEGYNKESRDKGPVEQARRHGYKQTEQSDRKGIPPTSK